MAERVKFTRAALDRLGVPAGTDRLTVHDAEGRHLVLTVRGGAKTFYVYRCGVDGRPQRIKVGAYPATTIDRARGRADEINGEIAKGNDPAAARRKARASMTLAELLGHYLDTHAKQHKRTWQDDVEQFARYFGKAEAERARMRQGGCYGKPSATSPP